MTFLPKRNKTHESNYGLNAAIVIFIILFLLVFIMTTMVFMTKVPTASMEPNIMTGDYVLARYYIGEPDVIRGDVVIFDNEEMDSKLIKRVVGVAGDAIEFKDGAVYINGTLDTEDYLPNGVLTYSDETYTVPDGCIFVLGDNRENSYDSRFWDNSYVRLDDVEALGLVSFGKHGGIHMRFI